ncbi:6-phosphofructokinase [Sulfuriroseicoccus oceanibius]|uniref:6-phosphofructokinase n=1 Tax=Sulfuriroseicoccus oceanibius TaxID=2707525 RepID=A0A6B3L8C4_9BACT|nr:6-phosphofructokinase [Sulfuriroseicoccus oceanibius]QQL45983.1 6-phosphofructokinase [Sulfuriroseicoccus oceanibius]
MSIAVMTSGGDAAGMNPAVKRFVDYSIEKGEKPYLIYDGLTGLLDGKIVEADKHAVSGILFRGGTILRSSRSQRFRDPEYRKIAYEQLEKRGIDKIVIIGGDGSFNAARVMSHEADVAVAGIPATIDNDIPCTDYCLGVDTALNVIREAIDGIRDTAASFRRTFVIETMGRNCGYLAAMSALTSGAEVCLIPEVDYDMDQITRRLNDEITQGRLYSIAVVAEGVAEGRNIAETLERKTNMEARLTILGHIQRGGSPTVLDRRMAFEFAHTAVEALLDGERSFVTVTDSLNVKTKPIDDVLSSTYELNPYICKMIHPLCH